MDAPDKALAHLLTGLEINGVAAVTVKDGVLYAFSKRKLQDLIDACQDDRVIVFVKHGPLAVDTPGN